MAPLCYFFSIRMSLCFQNAKGTHDDCFQLLNMLADVSGQILPRHSSSKQTHAYTHTNINHGELELHLTYETHLKISQTK